MKYDECGVAYSNTDELCDMLYKNPETDISKIYVEDPDVYNNAIDTLYADFPKLKLYTSADIDPDKFDGTCQSNWSMPAQYKELDIAQWLLDKCTTQEELQRVGEELLLYQERNLFNLLRQLKYIVDTWRTNGVVWGVGRGSSVASYVLYLIGIHRINSIYYDLNVHEFLR
jgi:hypothetical protein